MNLKNIRVDYSKNKLSKEDLALDPLVQFQSWMADCIDANVLEPNAMCLSTIDKDCKLSSRIVLLKGLDHGFHFYTNYESKKGRDLEQNSDVSLVFFWKEIERQVRIEGIAEKLDIETSTAYFQSRPIKSQIGAWASNQSGVIAKREDLEEAFEHYAKKFDGLKRVPKPPNWGGYRIIPSRIEFWQGRRSRLHDRFVYTKQDSVSDWSIERLAP